MLVESFPQEMEVNFTADMEEKLDLIEEGEDQIHQSPEESFGRII